MEIGVFSDVHDNLENLEKALDVFKERKIKTLLFLGDFCSPIPSRVIGGYDGEVHCVFGNGDGDPFTISKFANTEFPNLHLHGQHAELEFEKRKLAITHYPLYGSALARTGDYDAVFSGHTHELTQEKFGECIWVNPGEVMGWNGKPSCVVYDTKTNDVEVIRL